ncbi:MAG: FkbM family methyltransferase [Candidatus Kapabacteria bacterium]|nr:FkbM family methyltransferase [Candidatus Kapabacteria bacterium]
MRSILRSLFRTAMHMYPRERGKYSLLMRLYFPYFAPRTATKVTSTLKFGMRMHLDLTEYLQSHLYVFGDYELPTIRFIRQRLQANAVCIDVGAQMGYLTLAMATAAGRATTVHSFEPEDVNAKRFLENMTLNNLSNVHLHRCAVSNVDGTLRLYLSKDMNAGTHSTVYNPDNVSTDFIEIPSTTLDSFSTTHGLQRMDLVKIDVEGAEFDVLRGAETVLRTLRPCVILELSDALQKAHGTTCRQIKQHMADRGYSAFTIADDGTPVPSALDALHMNDNVVFLPLQD